MIYSFPLGRGRHAHLHWPDDNGDISGRDMDRLAAMIQALATDPPPPPDTEAPTP